MKSTILNIPVRLKAFAAQDKKNFSQRDEYALMTVENATAYVLDDDNVINALSVSSMEVISLKREVEFHTPQEWANKMVKERENAEAKAAKAAAKSKGTPPPATKKNDKGKDTRPKKQNQQPAAVLANAGGVPD